MKSTRRALTQPEPTGLAAGTASRRLFANRTRRGPFKVPSAKNGGVMVPCESALEALAALALEFQGNVLRYAPQPLVMDVVSGKHAPTREALKERLQVHERLQDRLWFPDFSLDLTQPGRDALVEVKPLALVMERTADMADRRAACTLNGLAFVLITDADLPDPLASNLKILTRYSGHKINVKLLPIIIGTAQCKGEWTTAALATASGCGIADIYCLIAQGILCTDYRGTLLGPGSVVSEDLESTATVLSDVFAREGIPWND